MWLARIPQQELNPSGFKRGFEPSHGKTNKMACAPSTDQPRHPPSLISVFAVHSMGAKDPSFLHADSEDSWLDWADAQADPILRWVHMPFCWFLSWGGSVHPCTVQSCLLIEVSFLLRTFKNYMLTLPHPYPSMTTGTGTFDPCSKCKSI